MSSRHMMVKLDRLEPNSDDDELRVWNLACSRRESRIGFVSLFR